MNNLNRFKHLPKAILDYMEEQEQRIKALEKQNEALGLLVLTLGEEDECS